MNKQPPKYTLRFFRWFCNPEFAEDVEGDLLERFEKRLNENKLAKWLLIKDVLRLFRPSMMRKPQLKFLDTMSIIHIKTSWRNLLKYKGYSITNIMGLVFGLAAVSILVMIIHHESSYDEFHSKHENIYRVGNKHPEGGTSDMIVTPQTPLMKDEYPEIIRSTRFFGNYLLLENGEKVVKSEFHLVDKDFAKMFDFPAIKGSLEEALSINKIAITETLANELFAYENPLGKTIRRIDEDQLFTVVCILKDPPSNSTLTFSALTSWENAPEWLDEDKVGNWYNTFNVGFVELQPEIEKTYVESKFSDFTNKHFLKDRKEWGLHLFPLEGEYARFNDGSQVGLVLTAIAFIILLVTVINFVNLTVSHSLGRIREVGVRKTLGSSKGQLVVQFFTESLLVTLIAMAIAIIVVFLTTPYIANYFEFGIDQNLLLEVEVLLALISLCFFIAFLSGFFPSLLFTRVHIIQSLKEQLGKGRSGKWVRKPLLVVQFACSYFLLLMSFVIWSQVDYMKSKDKNFSGKNVIAVTMWEEMFKNPEESMKKLQVLQNELEKESFIKSVSSSEKVPGKYNRNYNSFTDKDNQEHSLLQLWIDHNYLETMEIELVAGVNFTDGKNQNCALINEATMKVYGWKDLTDKYLLSGGSGKPQKVIGVVKDFNYSSLKEEIEPIFIRYSSLGNTLAIKVAEGFEYDAIKAISAMWNELNAYTELDYFFVDEEFDRQYAENEKLGTVVTLFSGLGVIIALFGLFASVSYSIKIKQKEIGIRKVVGASKRQIVQLLLKNYVWLILIGLTIGAIVGYISSAQFLEAYAYRISREPSLFILSGLLIVGCAALLTTMQTLKVAKVNPSHSLRSE
ncbi:FtsX-like permease family protein [Ekhidna sp.]